MSPRTACAACSASPLCYVLSVLSLSCSMPSMIVAVSVLVAASSVAANGVRSLQCVAAPLHSIFALCVGQAVARNGVLLDE